MSVSSALFCTAAIPNVTDIAMHILWASRRTCTTTYSLIISNLAEGGVGGVGDAFRAQARVQKGVGKALGSEILKSYLMFTTSYFLIVKMTRITADKILTTNTVSNAKDHSF